ncbi:MAG: DNA primase, partial [Deltaproteobacteria bacterium]|nr:DNA primase [Deltaproteobacteria bacterium]
MNVETMNPDLDNRELLLRVVEFYHRTLKESPKALGYLEKRGLRSPEMVERFMLGYCDRSLGPLLPARDRKAGRDLRRRLVELGILAKSGHERLRGSITIPIFDESGHVAQVYGRKAGVRLRKGTELHTWLDDGRCGVWNLPALNASTEVILCGGLIDALSFWCAGLRN